MLDLCRANINLARWVLLWFVLSLGFAIAAPIVKLQSADMVCSSTGFTKLMGQDQGGKALNLPSLDCPVCAMVSAPPPAAIHWLEEQTASFTFVFSAIYIARIAVLALPPLPARGPPAHS